MTSQNRKPRITDAVLSKIVGAAIQVDSGCEPCVRALIEGLMNALQIDKQRMMDQVIKSAESGEKSYWTKEETIKNWGCFE